MNTVYILWDTNQEISAILGIFSSRANAEQEILNFKKKDGAYYMDFHIEEWQLDEGSAHMHG